MDHTKGQEIIKESIHKLEEEINDISGRIKEIRKKREEVTGGPKIKKEEIRKLKQEDRSEENKLTKNYKSKSAHLKLLRDKFDKNKLQHKCKIETIGKLHSICV
jgi:chromosome segregation ATPase